MTMPYRPDNPFAPKSGGAARYRPTNPFTDQPDFSDVASGASGDTPGLTDRLAGYAEGAGKALVGAAKGIATAPAAIGNLVFGDPTEEEAANPLLRASRLARLGPGVARLTPTGGPTPGEKAVAIGKAVVTQPIHDIKTLAGDASPEAKGEAATNLALTVAPFAAAGASKLRSVSRAAEAARTADEAATLERIATAPKENEAFRAGRRNAVLRRAQEAAPANAAASQGVGKLADAERRVAVETEPPSETSQLIRQADAGLLAPQAEREAQRAAQATRRAAAEAEAPSATSQLLRAHDERVLAAQRARAAEPVPEPTPAPVPPITPANSRAKNLRAMLGNEQGALRTSPPAVTEGLPPDVAGAYRRRAAAIDFTGQLEKSAATSTKGALSTRIQRFGDAIANDRGPIERLGTLAERADPTFRPTQNPKYLLSYQKESSATVERAITEGVPDALSRDTAGPSYKSLFAPFGQNDRRIQQALTYAVEKRGTARGIDAYGGDAQAFRDAQTLVQHFDADPEMVAFAGRLGQYTDALGNYAVQSGRWTPEQWAAIKGSDALYIPYRRLMDSLIQSGGRGGTGRRLMNVTSGVKAFVGSRRSLANPAVALAEYTDAIIRGSDAYRVGAALFDAADRLGEAGQFLLTPVANPAIPIRAKALNAIKARAAANGDALSKSVVETLGEMFEPAIDPKHPVIWRNGPNGREYRVVNAPDLYQAVAGLHAAPGAVQKVLDLTLLPMRRIFTAATTAFVPRFAGGTNPARDVLDALAKTQHGVTPVDLARGYVEALGGVVGAENVPRYLPRLQQAFQAVGVDLGHMPGLTGIAGEAKRHGLGGVSQFGDVTTPAMAARRYAPTTMGQRIRGTARSVVMGDRSPLAKVEKVFEASDLGPRLGEYAAAKRNPAVIAKLRSGVWTPTDVELYAASAGRPITLDFSNVPGNPVLRAYARYVPFVRPALQSPVRFAEATARNPKRMAAYATAISGAAVGAWLMKHRSPEALAATNDRPKEERAGFLLFPVDDEAHVTLRMPLGQETALIAAGTTALLDAWADHDPNAASTLIEAMSRALPPGLDEWVQGNPEVPIPLVQQIQENDRNRRFFGNAPVESERMQALSPEERRNDQTPATYSLLSRATGGRVSPLKLQNLAKGVLSQSEPFVTAATDVVAKPLLGADAPVVAARTSRSNPLNPLTAFVASDPPYRTQSEDQYYALRDRYRQAAADARAAEQNQDFALVRRITERGDLPLVADDRAKDLFRAADRELRALADQRRAVLAQAKAGASPDDVRAVLDELTRRQQAIYRNAMSLWGAQSGPPAAPAMAAR